MHSPAAASQTAAQSALGQCSYETCAIRLERAFFSGRKVNVGGHHRGGRQHNGGRGGEAKKELIHLIAQN